MSFNANSRPIIFVDTVCPKPYDPTTLITEGLGGTEASVIRIAEGLGTTHPVWVMQHNRKDIAPTFNAVYKPLKAYLIMPEFKAKAYVVLRNPEVAINLRKRHMDTPVYLWLHDIVDASMIAHAALLGSLGITLVVVSDWHKLNLVEHLKINQEVKEFPRVRRIYNPIEDGLVPDTTPTNCNKLVFFSSPHKGLDYTLRTYLAARYVNPKFELFIANPGYFPSTKEIGPGITNLGVLSHQDIIKHVREALCVFYPNYVYPETFGLVMAEANAVGVPVLTHRLGASMEVLDDNGQLLDVRSIPRLIERLMLWYRGDRPKVEGKDAFRLTNVLKSWHTLLGEK